MKCIRCGVELDFWKYYRTQICDECDKELDEKVKRITERLNKKMKDKNNLEKEVNMRGE